MFSLRLLKYAENLEILESISCKLEDLIDGLQSLPRDSSADEESFVIVFQHGGNDVTCKFIEKSFTSH